MSTVENGNTIKIHYKGRLNDGEIFDSSEGRDPLEFTVGGGQVIPGFDEGVKGMSIGDKKTIEIPCAEAYGEYRDDLAQDVPKDQFPPDLNPEVGQTLQVMQQNGAPMMVTVKEIKEAAVTLDANHPLAGKDLIFDLELVAIS